MTIAKFYAKQPSEQETVKIDWSNRAASLVLSGYAISSVTVVIYDSSGTDVSASMLEGSPSYLVTDIYFTVKAGTSGAKYYAKITVTLTKAGEVNQVQEEDLKIEVLQIYQ